MYIWESCGIGNLKQGLMNQLPGQKLNGFAIGKKWATVTVEMWKKDIKDGLLFESELYREGKYPSEWLDEVLYGTKK